MPDAGMLECTNARMPGMPECLARNARMPAGPGMPDAGMPGMPECQKLHTVQVHSTAAFWLAQWTTGEIVFNCYIPVMHTVSTVVVE